VSKTVLWIVIGVATFVVVALAVLTPTVIVDDDDGNVRIARVDAPGAAEPAPFPVPRGQLPELKRCLQGHGFGGPEQKLPTPDQFRDAFRDCAPGFGSGP
jgi:hypothetical protein